MIYGPMARAIEELLEIYIARPPKKDKEGNTQYQADIAAAWRTISRAHDEMIERVLDGSLRTGD